MAENNMGINPATVPVPATWLDRVVKELHEGEPSVGMLKAAFEAAIEMRLLTLKVALGRCLEIIRISENSEAAADVHEGFLSEIERLSK